MGRATVGDFQRVTTVAFRLARPLTTAASPCRHRQASHPQSSEGASTTNVGSESCGMGGRQGYSLRLSSFCIEDRFWGPPELPSQPPSVTLSRRAGVGGRQPFLFLFPCQGLPWGRRGANIPHSTVLYLPHSQWAQRVRATPASHKRQPTGNDDQSAHIRVGSRRR